MHYILRLRSIGSLNGKPMGKEEDVVGRSSSVGKILHRAFLSCA